MVILTILYISFTIVYITSSTTPSRYMECNALKNRLESIPNNPFFDNERTHAANEFVSHGCIHTSSAITGGVIMGLILCLMVFWSIPHWIRTAKTRFEFFTWVIFCILVNIIIFYVIPTGNE
jgi:hypothetical protein